MSPGRRGGAGRPERGPRPDDRRRDRGPDRREERAERGLGGEQVEGIHAVHALLSAGRRRVREVWIATSRTPSEELDEIIDLAMEARATVREVAPAQLAARAGTDAPQGVMARAAAVEPADLDELLAAPDAFLVALDGVTDPGNLGAVLRSADAAGATGVVLPRHRSARLSPSAVKAAAGAVEWLPIAQAAGVPALLDRAQRAGVWSVGLDMDAEVDIHDLAVADRPLVLVLGAEGRGLARLTRERCDVVASIAMGGHVESLNVSAAAAVACFAIARVRARG